MNTYQIQEFVSSVLIVFEGAGHRTGHGYRVLLLDAAHDHAEVLRLNDYGHAARMNFFINRICNLSSQPLLHLKASGIHVHQPRYLAQADDTAIWNVPYMAFSEERKQMMLAQAEELDVSNDNHFVISDIEQSLVQQIIRVHPVTAGEKPECTIDSLRSVPKPVTRGV